MSIFDWTFLDGGEDWIFSLFQHQIILIPMLLLAIDEAGFPFPLGDFIVIYTGYQVSQGHISYFTAFILLLIPLLLGASFLYSLSSRFGEHILIKLGKYIDLDEKNSLKLRKSIRNMDYS